MSLLHLTIACGEYDRTLDLIDGSIRPAGIRLNYLRMSPPEIFRRMIRFQEFDVCEMSLAGHIMLTARGDSPFVGIPVFPGRAFRHSYIFVNARSGLHGPEDLVNARVGVPEYHMTAALFNRGMLSDDHRIRAGDIEWFQGGVEHPGRRERLEYELPDEITIHRVEDRTLDDMLVDGEIDALFAAAIPPSVRRGDDQVRRLYADPRKAEIDWYERTGIFPIMHVVVLKRDVFESNPWIAANIVDAFERAKASYYAKISRAGTTLSALPFFRLELEETIRRFGADFIPYGVESNRTTLGAAIRYAREQHLITGALEIEDLFVPNTLAGVAE